MKLKYEAPICDYFGSGALKGGILKCRLDCPIPEKNQTGGLKIYIFEKTHGIFCFFTLAFLEIPDKIKLHLQKFHKIMLPICVTSLGNCLFFFQFFSRYILEQYILDLCTIVYIKEFGLWLFFSCQRELHSVPNMNLPC